MLGYEDDEIGNMVSEWDSRIHPDDHEKTFAEFNRHLDGETPVYISEHRVLCKDGSYKWILDRGKVISWTAEGEPLRVIGTHSDITERKRLEDEHQRVAKLESLGVLAGGIAHDFNNILTAIMGNIGLVSAESPAGSEIRERLEAAQKALLRARDITRQLLTFSKGGTPVKKLASLHDLVKDTANFALHGSSVKCQFCIADNLWHAEVDEGQISQVIHNLVINAEQAMPRGGTIRITVENKVIDRTQRVDRGLPIKEGNYIRIAVTDHGGGIAEENIDKIFDPFFTTKTSGSGLGLATSFSIARNHGGHISVQSRPGAGTTFFLYLPASSEKTFHEQDVLEQVKPVRRARILIMDDEQLVSEVAGRMLKHIGYTDIEVATDGSEAIGLYKAAMESDRPFSLAILDLTIPGGIGGKDVISALLQVDPDVKAIVSSGYADQSVMSEYKEYGFVGMVAKPYTIEELSKSVNEALNTSN